MLKLSYNINSDITSQKIDVAMLHLEIETVGYPVDGITLSGLNFEISFEDELTPSIAIDAIVLAHSGASIPKFKFHVASPLIQQEVDVIQKNEWQVIAGVFVNPSFFMEDLTRAVIVVTGTVLHQGSDFEIRVVEISDEGNRVLTPVCEHGILENADWHGFTLYNNTIPKLGEHIYQLEAKLNTTTMAKLKFCNVVLLESI